MSRPIVCCLLSLLIAGNLYSQHVEFYDISLREYVSKFENPDSVHLNHLIKNLEYEHKIKRVYFYDQDRSSYRYLKVDSNSIHLTNTIEYSIGSDTSTFFYIDISHKAKLKKISIGTRFFNRAIVFVKQLPDSLKEIELSGGSLKFVLDSSFVLKNRMPSKVKFNSAYTRSLELDAVDLGKMNIDFAFIQTDTLLLSVDKYSVDTGKVSIGAISLWSKYFKFHNPNNIVINLESFSWNQMGSYDILGNICLNVKYFGYKDYTNKITEVNRISKLFNVNEILVAGEHVRFNNLHVYPSLHRLIIIDNTVVLKDITCPIESVRRLQFHTQANASASLDCSVLRFFPNLQILVTQTDKKPCCDIERLFHLHSVPDRPYH